MNVQITPLQTPPVRDSHRDDEPGPGEHPFQARDEGGRYPRVARERAHAERSQRHAREAQ